jgi:DmsE family decaheme c-type cytochrome
LGDDLAGCPATGGFHVPYRLTLTALCLAALAVTVRVTGSSPSEPAAPLVQAPVQAPAQQPPQPAAAQAAGYAGSDTCVLCHTEQEEKLKGTPHAQAKNPRAPAARQGCESCHGPGQAHVDDEAKGHMRKFSQMSPGDINEACLTCHNRGDHAGWEGSAHESRKLSCTTCHSVHSPKSPERQLVTANQTELCARCHRPQVAKTERAVAHMPVREGKMSCSSCHNPHGSINNVKALRTGSSVAESCISCHTEMRGPVLWEHAPVRENCATCHDPHGSSNDRMLVVRMPMLCQRCHIYTRHPASIYDKDEITTNKSNRMFGRSCVNCHSNVHGSNHPSGQFFMR